MPDYPEMYRILFRSQSKAIALLQEAQIQTEEMYIARPPKAITLASTEENAGQEPGE